MKKQLKETLTLETLNVQSFVLNQLDENEKLKGGTRAQISDGWGRCDLPEDIWK